MGELEEIRCQLQIKNNNAMVDVVIQSSHTTTGKPAVIICMDDFKGMAHGQAAFSLEDNAKPSHRYQEAHSISLHMISSKMARQGGYLTHYYADSFGFNHITNQLISAWKLVVSNNYFFDQAIFARMVTNVPVLKQAIKTLTPLNLKKWQHHLKKESVIKAGLSGVRVQAKIIRWHLKSYRNNLRVMVVVRSYNKFLTAEQTPINIKPLLFFMLIGVFYV